MAYEKAGVTLPEWGNAKQWYNDAKNDGYTVGTTPTANSIIVWGGWTAYGHVGSEGSIDLNKDTLEYTIKVENKISKIAINSTVEDTKSSVEGNGEYKLKAGVNQIKLAVKTEDGTVKEYQINIIRNIKNKNLRVKNKINYTPIIIITAVDVIIIITVILFYIFRKKIKNINKRRL